MRDIVSLDARRNVRKSEQFREVGQCLIFRNVQKFLIAKHHASLQFLHGAEFVAQVCCFFKIVQPCRCFHVAFELGGKRFAIALDIANEFA